DEETWHELNQNWREYKVTYSVNGVKTTEQLNTAFGYYTRTNRHYVAGHHSLFVNMIDPNMTQMMDTLRESLKAVPPKDAGVPPDQAAAPPDLSSFVLP